jgi:SPP1 gp7 family putative phage head morphogenesis protein
MPDPATLRFGEVPFVEAIQALRDLVPMSDADFYALSEVARNRAISFTGAYADSEAAAVQKVIEGILDGSIPVGSFAERANAALGAFGTELSAFQADTIFETMAARVFGQGKDAQYANPVFREKMPYVGWVSAHDVRVRPNHFALDYRRIKTVFRHDDPLWQQFHEPLGFRCRCTRLAFSEEQVASMGLTVGTGMDWYGKTVEVTLPGGVTRAAQVIPDAGFGSAGLAGRLRAIASALVLLGYDPGQPRDSLGRWVDANGGGLDERHNIARGHRALRRALRHKADVQKAMYRKEVGAIHFEWGRPGSPKADYEDGYGISHIEAKHGRAAALKLPVVLAKGRITPHDQSPDKRYVIHEDTLAVLQRQNKKSAFVVTSYDDRKRTSIGGR